PNGAGKSTLVTRVLQPQTHLRFVNADSIAAQRWPEQQEAHAYDAARLAEAQRRALIAAGESFIAETVFSHPSKVALIEAAQAYGFLVYLHVVMVPVAVTLGRVEHRVRHGGHTVPEQKILERYDRLWPLVARARELADTTRFTTTRTTPRLFGRSQSTDTGDCREESDGVSGYYRYLIC